MKIVEKKSKFLITQLFFVAFISAAVVLSGQVIAEQNSCEEEGHYDVEKMENEIWRMIKTQERDVLNFKKEYITTARIDCFVNAENFHSYAINFKVNTLIFAGESEALTFDKPSDILQKMERWFPQEIAESRDNDYVHRDPVGATWYGPYPHWGDEQAAFYALWRTMMARAWVYPKQIPFTHERGYGNYVLPFAGRLTSPQFRFAETISKKISDYFDQSLCADTGPDDCVLLLFLLFDLQPENKSLKDLLLRIETEVQPTAPMSAELHNTISTYNTHNPAIAAEGLRKAALLRIKLDMMLKHPDWWQEQDWDTLFSQMTVFRTNYSPVFQKYNLWRVYDDDSGDSELNPWLLLTEDSLQNPKMQTSILKALNTIEKGRCDVYQQWVQHLPKDFRMELTEKIIKQQSVMRTCAQAYH